MQIKSVSYKEKEKILSHALLQAKSLTTKESFTGTSPAPFVGRFGYPNVNVGILAPTEHDENAWQYDAPNKWAEENLGIREIVEYRVRMVNNRFVSNIKQTDKLVEIAQDVAMSKKAIDVDVELDKKPGLRISTDQWVAPMGPQAKLKKLALSSNPKIPSKVQKCYDDTDLLAADALKYLYKKEIDENALMRMLSVGSFGKAKNRKLVPTRWSITATDDIISKDLLMQIKDCPIGDYAVYFGSYLGNYYLLLCFPEIWSYELFEMYCETGKNAWKNGEIANALHNRQTLEYSTDYEDFNGRKTYAETCAGGYYTVRLAIAEHFKKIKRQHSVLALRFITDEYVLPLGVWVTREATRKALINHPITFGSKELMLSYAKQLAKKKFGVNIQQILKQSKLLKEKQKSLHAFG
ncbi:hypothetical protein COV18_01020 [Candidatus Woesearchaeota archaeon CG10_big_fil_rev_8_21_14_0_10_37_12]|nr:MAG: hypothetical protein COV18_01020 [Candidatus Woesearchaeota archaeon CG10_big_fil_rev_8_21_14_0_10_37_12]